MNNNYKVEELREINLEEELKNMKYYYKVRINLNGNIDSMICEPTLNCCLGDISIDFIDDTIDNSTNYLEIILFKSWNDKEQIINICKEILKDFNDLVIERPTEDYDTICEALEIQYWEDEE